MNSGATRTHFRRIGYLLVFLMAASGSLTVQAIFRSALPDWHAGIIAAVMVFIVADRLFTYRGLKDLTPFSSEWLLAIGAQWLMILIVLRLLLSYANGLDAFLSDLAQINRGSLAHLFTAEFVVSFLLAMLAWYLTGEFLGLLDLIGLEQELASSEETALIRSDLVPARQRLVSLIFGLGIVLVVLTGLARVNLRTVVPSINGESPLELNRLSGGEAGALLYFAFGLALLSLSRLMSLQTRWNRQRIPVSSGNLARQWALYSLVFLFLLAMIVSLLPAGDSLGFFSLLGTLISFLAAILFFIGQLILMLVSLLFSLPFLLLRGEPVGAVSPPPPLPTMPPVAPSAPAPGNELWELIRSILLWGVVLAIVAFAVIQFVRQHGGLREALRQSRITNWLLIAWQWLYRNAGTTGESLSRAISEGWKNISSRLESRRTLAAGPLLRLRSLDPRRQVYFYYLAMIRRGGEQGVPRKTSQTPAEYAAALEKAIPSAEDDIGSLTDAFVEARYSRRDVDATKANVVKETWARIRRAMQSTSNKE
jgi:hypothetical protein